MHHLLASILLTLLLTKPLLSSSESLTTTQEASEISISLSTDTNLIPVAAIWEGMSQEDPYLKRLQAVLNFDLVHSGHVQPMTIAREKILFPAQGSLTDQWKRWQKAGALFVIELTISPKELSAKLYDVAKRRSLQSARWELEGIINKDRSQIHKLSDWLIFNITGQKGIACSKLLFTVNPLSGNSLKHTQVFQSDYDGANAKAVLSQESLLVTPTYLPSKERSSRGFAVVSYKLGQPKIMLASFSGALRRVSALGGNQLSPTFDKKGETLCFIGDVDGNPSVYLMKIDLYSGKGQKPVRIFSCKKATQASPTFSPDGKQLAFVSSKDGDPRIYIIDIAAQLANPTPHNARLISRKNSENTCPSWSPDGRYIAYSARNSSIRQIWVYDTQNQTEICLTEGSGTKENPVWAADSFHLFYNQEMGKDCQLFMINLKTKKPVKVSSVAGSARFPSCWP